MLLLFALFLLACLSLIYIVANTSSDDAPKATSDEITKVIEIIKMPESVLPRVCPISTAILAAQEPEEQSEAGTGETSQGGVEAAPEQLPEQSPEENAQGGAAAVPGGSSAPNAAGRPRPVNSVEWWYIPVGLLGLVLIFVLIYLWARRLGGAVQAARVAQMPNPQGRAANDCSEERARIQQLEAANEKLNTDYQAIFLHSNDIGQRLQDSNKAVEKLTQEKQDLNTTIQEQSVEIKKLNDDISAKINIEQITSEKTQFQQQNTSLAETNRQLQDRLSSVTADNKSKDDSLQQLRQQLRQQLGRMEEMVRETDKDNKNLLGEIRELTTTNETLRSTNLQLSDETLSLRQQLDTCNERQEQLLTITGEMKQLEKTNDNLNIKLKTVTALRDSLITNLEQCRNSLNAANRELERLRPLVVPLQPPPAPAAQAAVAPEPRGPPQQVRNQENVAPLLITNPLGNPMRGLPGGTSVTPK